jgi:hypothetical protein
MKDPAFLFYSSDFLTGTYFLNDTQVGKFIRLLCFHHQKGRLTKEHMLKICLTYDKDIFDLFTKDENGLYFNERLESEVDRRKKYSESRRSNRKKKTKNEVPVLNISKTYDQHMETETETENITITKTEVEIWPSFEDFWDLYNKKVGSKSKLIKKWESLTDLDRGLIIEHLPHYVKSTPDKNFRKNPETYLNNQGWFDEIVISQNGVIDFDLDGTGKFYKGYCDKCNEYASYRKEDLYGESNCCNAKILKERKKYDKKSN